MTKLPLPTHYEPPKTSQSRGQFRGPTPKSSFPCYSLLHRDTDDAQPTTEVDPHLWIVNLDSVLSPLALLLTLAVTLTLTGAGTGTGTGTKHMAVA
ncbi:hypothetical protein J7T55_003054 [Diaporthe amygdali]|uniref:uncharacterized protein n=1 Tax=Phomopsis amygdali TaxID=1214568 RepID=UPI0022FDF3AA|nr:uncharacterized protein J7T55_003054 [Diaporthe amygdali]KAJ0122540.1 hypothetical protein J7T55_003054 [Diaporthe amygdali]